MKNRTPDLLVHWEPRWRSFFGSCNVAMRRQRGPKRTGVPSGAPLAIPMASVAAHLVAGAALLAFAGQVILVSRDPKPTPHFAHQFESVIYFGPHLPEIQDTNGAAAGLGGDSGSNAGRADQVIKVARGPEIKSRIADTPPLWLPPSSDSAANLVMLARSAANQAAPAGNQVTPPSLQAADTLPLPLIRDVQRHGLSIAVPETTVVPPPAKGAETLAARSRVGFTAVAVPPSPTEEARALNAKMFLPALQAAPPPADNRRPVSAAPADIESLAVAVPTKVLPDPAEVARAASLGSIHGSAGSDGAVSLVLSATPNNQLGIPAGGPGTLILSSSGKPAAVAGVATGTGNVPGAGTALTGSGTGSSTHGSGFGSSEAASGGIAPGPGRGGTGGKAGPSTGVTISASEVYIPSFAGTTTGPSAPGRAPREKAGRSSFIVMATPRGGGGLDPRFAPAGNRVYTIYLRTRSGSTVLQFSDTDGSVGAELTPPAPISIELPADIKLAQVVIGFVLDSTGKLRDFHVVEATNTALAAKAINALSHWLFRPALRGDQPLAVNAVIGFGVNTN